MYVCIWFTLRHFISIYCILSHSPFHSYCLCCRHIECLWLGFTIIYFWTLAIRIVVSAAADRVVQAFAVHTYIHSVFTCSLDCFYKFFLRKFVIVVFNSYQLFVLILSSSPQHSLFAFSCVCVCDFKYIIYLLLLWVVVTLKCCCLTSCCCGNYHPHLLL